MHLYVRSSVKELFLTSLINLSSSVFFFKSPFSSCLHGCFPLEFLSGPPDFCPCSERHILQNYRLVTFWSLAIIALGSHSSCSGACLWALICCMCPSFSDHWTSSCSACAQQSPVLQEAGFSPFVLPPCGFHPHCSDILIFNALRQVMQQVQRTCSVGIVWTSPEETK